MFVDQFFQPGDKDDTASFNRAFASDQKRIRAAGRTYIISGPISVGQTGISFQGENQFSTLIQQNALGAPVFISTGPYSTFEDFAIIYNGTPVAGTTAIQSRGGLSPTILRAAT